MQSNIFAKVAPLLKEKKFNVDCDVIISFLSNYNYNDWIYPDAMHRKLKLSIQDIYDILEICAKENLLTKYLQIYCPKCQRFTGNCYKTILEVPELINCIHCDEEINNALRHSIIIYKVKR